jgi:hypothetical protein
MSQNNAPRITIALVSQKGGVGKTTLATNLAAAAHLEGRRTLVLDLDPQGSSLDWSAARSEGSKLDGLAVAKTDRALTVPRFRELSQGYDVVILDAAPRMNDLTRAAVVAADIAVVPLRPSGLDYWASAETVAALDSADAVREQLRAYPGRADRARRSSLGAALGATRSPTSVGRRGATTRCAQDRPSGDGRPTGIGSKAQAVGLRAYRTSIPPRQTTRPRLRPAGTGPARPGPRRAAAPDVTRRRGNRPCRYRARCDAGSRMRW